MPLKIFYLRGYKNLDLPEDNCRIPQELREYKPVERVGYESVEAGNSSHEAEARDFSRVRFT